MKVGVVTRIFLHPLKCGKALAVEEVECNPRGPNIGSLRDRGFMVANTTLDAVDLRGKHPRLVLVELAQMDGVMWRLSGMLAKQNGGLVVT